MANNKYRNAYVVIFLVIISQLILLLSVMPHINSATVSEKTLESVLNLGPTVDTNYHIPTGKEPLYIQLVYKELDKESLFVSNFDSDTVSIFSVDNDTKIAQDIIIDEPRDMEVDNYTDVLYLISSATKNVSIIDGSSNTKLRDDIELDMDSDESPVSLAIDSNNTTSTLYVTIRQDEEEKGEVYVINGKTDKLMKNITVEKDPRAIEIDEKNKKLYVANNQSDSVSVIDTSSGVIKDWKVVSTIPVGKNPQAIEIYNNTLTLVANTGSNTVSVLDTTDTNESKWTVKKNITVGEGPRAIAKYDNETIYVANIKSHTVSVINTTDKNLSKWAVDVEPITVGKGPIDFAIDTRKEKVYVANSVSNTLSVIDPSSNSLRGGFSFEVIPFNSGQIECNSHPVPTSVYLYINSTTSCKAIPNKGYSFLALSKVQDDNSTQLIVNAPSFSTLYDYVWSASIFLLNFLGIGPSGLGTDLNINQFGTYVASFRESAPPLPPEFWGTIFSFVLSTILAVWLIPPLTRRFKSRKEAKKYNQHCERIISFNESGALDLKEIVYLKTDIKNDYLKDSINQKQYASLMEEISDLEYTLLKKNISQGEDSK
jgi:YVTN family beta-propeller protein